VTRRWIAADGYRARPAGPWTRDKLRYMERYASAFMTAMAPKRRQGKWNHLAYIDLLAGPGKGIDRATRAEFDGLPLRALRVRPKFDRVYLGDARARNVAILRKRIGTDDLERVHIEVGDCNVRARRIVESLPSKTLGLAFIDPEGFEATFSMFRALASRPIDILLLFPSGIGIRRNLRAFVTQSSSPMDALWGGPELRDLPPAKQAAGRRLSAAEADTLDRPWVQRFREKMTRIGFEYQDESDPCFRNIRNVPMYHLLFFSRHSAGLQIWKNTKKIEPTGQRPLPGF
jgi:three-Cys-motif partner protein